jgi:membrane-bound metal-dependent hydrolase YbcI (DUF457 family)
MMGKTHSAAGALACAALLPPTSSILGIDLSPEALAAGILIGVIAGVLPDIDHPDSLVTHGIIPGSRKLGVVGKILGWLLSIPPRIVGLGARAKLNHRGGTHSILFALAWALLAAPLYGLMIAVLAIIISPIWDVTIGSIGGALGSDWKFTAGQVIDWLVANLPTAYPLISLSVFIGYMSHLCCDAMTKVPVPFLWPMRHKGKNGKQGDYIRYFILPKALRIKTDSPFENKVIRPAIYIALLFLIGIEVIFPMADQAISSDGTKSN